MFANSVRKPTMIIRQWVYPTIIYLSSIYSVKYTWKIKYAKNVSMWDVQLKEGQ
jgi:hypothetical protein